GASSAARGGDDRNGESRKSQRGPGRSPRLLTTFIWCCPHTDGRCVGSPGRAWFERAGRPRSGSACPRFPATGRARLLERGRLARTIKEPEARKPVRVACAGG